jgi:AcrR family transcriptional regulator
MDEPRAERKQRGTSDESQAKLGRAAIEAMGEVGYSELSVALILERSGVSRSTFYARFSNKDECCLDGYATGIDALVDRLLSACEGASSWRRAVVSALRELAGAIEEEPAFCRGLIVQGRVVPGTDAPRGPALDRLLTAIDAARAEADPSSSPPPTAASFVFGAVENAAAAALALGAPAQFASTIPDLAFLAVATYFGAEVARAESP